MQVTRKEIGAIHSRIVEHNGVIYLSGLAADDKKLTIKGQTEQTLAKIDRFLAMAGTDKSKLLTATIYLADMNDKAEMNEVWQAWIDADNPPTRACVGAALAPGTLIEIVVSAVR